jgi:hypothetical protein
MALKRHSSMVGIRKQVSQMLGWPGAQVRWVRDQVAERLDASSQAARDRYARAREENAARGVEVSAPSTSGPGSASGKE